METRGYELARGAVSRELCAALRNDVLDEAARARRRWRWPWRPAAPPVRSPARRAHVALPLSRRVRGCLGPALGALASAGACARAALGDDARLVELSAMVAFPGARAQARTAAATVGRTADK